MLKWWRQRKAEKKRLHKLRADFFWWRHYYYDCRYCDTRGWNWEPLEITFSSFDKIDCAYCDGTGIRTNALEIPEKFKELL